MMIARNVMMMLVLTTLVVSSGCCNMKTLFFGRGARCGLGNPLSRGLGSCGLGSCSLNPFKKRAATPTCSQPIYAQPAPGYAPTYAPTYQTPAYQPAPAYQPSSVVTAPQCQCESHGNAYGPAADECVSCNSGYAMAHDGCTCGASHGYGPAMHDPYASSGIVYDNGAPNYGENIVSDVIVGQGGVPIGSSNVIDSGNYMGSGAVTLPQVSDDDGFRGALQPSLGPVSNGHMTDQFDRDGNRIINRQPVN